MTQLTKIMSSKITLGMLSWLLILSSGNLRAAEIPTEGEAKQKLIGTPETIEVSPKTIELKGKKDHCQVLVTGKYSGLLVRDLTHLAVMSLESGDVANLETGGYIRPLKNGVTKLKVVVGKLEAVIPVVVINQEKTEPTSFRNEVIAALNVGGCNAGACHGTPSGKNGFRLSLRGFDPPTDYIQLTRDVLARRTVAMEPEGSLMVLKGLGKVPHEGGQRFPTTGEPARAIHQWIAEGLKDDPANLPGVKELQVNPASRLLRAPAAWQQLQVRAVFSDGSSRDVTRLSVFSSSDPALAEINQKGLIEFKQPGEVAVLVRFLEELVSVRFTYLETGIQFAWEKIPSVNYIDTLTNAKLKLMGVPPSDLCTDQEFLRRAYLDSCGILPTPEETKAFLANNAPDKRIKLIESLLSRSEFADFWTMKWSDILRSNRKTIQVKGIHSFQSWVRAKIEEKAGVDTMVKELITSSGNASVNPAANYYRVARDPQSLAETTAQLFLGFRMQCAKCHNHPFERWTQDDYYSLAAFFARVKVRKDSNDVGPMPQTDTGETIFESRAGEVTQPRSGKVMGPKFPGGQLAKIESGQNRRDSLADWMVSPENTFFSKSMVNRIWFHIMGRGIVDPVDDFRESNPSANDELLEALAKDFSKNKFDFRYLIKTIMSSRTYQLSAQPRKENQDDVKYFSHAITRLLTAEQLLDAICSITEVPEKFAGMPLGTRATQLPDTEVNHLFLKTFGQPARELACECERESDSNLAQALQLINGPTINDKIRNPNNRIGRLIGAKKSDNEILQEMFLATVNRLPTEIDLKVAVEHLAKAKDKRLAFEDLQWALINSKEFLFRH